MNRTIKTLTERRVSDVMSKEVVTLGEQDTMRAAARVLHDAGVTGAPVVDDAGHVVGVLSSMDFVEQLATGDSDRCPVTEVLVRDTPTGPYHVEQVDNDRVSRHMSSFVQTIDRDASILEASRQMCVQRLHRLFVLDSHGRPEGVVSALDVLAALADNRTGASPGSKKGAPK